MMPTMYPVSSVHSSFIPYLFIISYYAVLRYVSSTNITATLNVMQWVNLFINVCTYIGKICGRYVHMEWSRNVHSYVVYFSENCENVM